MSNIFCGIGDVPKGKKRGSMAQCAEMGQIRYYGVKKVDQKLISSVIKDKKTRSSLKKTTVDKKLELLYTSMASATGQITKLKKQIAAEKDAKEKDKYKKELAKVEKKLQTIREQISDIKSQSKKKISRTSKKLY
jgi:hypothetical protein